MLSVMNSSTCGFWRSDWLCHGLARCCTFLCEYKNSVLGLVQLICYFHKYSCRCVYKVFFFFPFKCKIILILGMLLASFLNSNLMFITEWKQIVARLILMSYELSAVVSPVVQSSSPEGLIPMDIDSGKQTNKQTNKKNSVKSEALEVVFIS